jgi:antitoxin HigA-1
MIIEVNELEQGVYMAIERKQDPNWKVHPGEILREEFLKPLSISSYKLAQELHVPTPRINDIVLEKRGITPETAVLLAKFFNTSEQFWMNLQADYDLVGAKKEMAQHLKKITPRMACAGL